MEWKRLLQIASRNARRNPRRSFLTGFLIAMGIASLIIVSGMTTGMSQIMVQQTTATYLGSFKIYHPEFPAENETFYTIPKAAEVQSALEKHPSVKSYTPRTLAQGMLSSSAEIAAIQLVGVDPEQEAQVSKLKEAMKEGQYLEAEEGQQIILGSELVRRLDIEIGDRLVLTTTAAPRGEMRQELFRLSGIFEFRLNAMDQSMAFIPLHRSQEILGIPGGIHEYIVQFDHAEDAIGETGKELTKIIHEIDPNLVAQSWYDEYPSLSGVLEMSSYSTFIIGLILFAMICLSVMNTLFMSIYERFYEFGILRALGTRPSTLFQSIVLETAVIAGFGCLIGMIIGACLNYYVSIYGIDYGEMEMMNIRFYEPIRSIFIWTDLITIPLMIWILTVLVSFYPAWHAIRIQTLDAMRQRN
ncbi:MAG: ABC transporter permease [Oligoflexus sp.]